MFDGELNIDFFCLMSVFIS